MKLDGVLYLCTAITFDHDEEEIRIGLEVVDD